MTRHHDDSTADGLYQAILAEPRDLLVRRVYADRLDEIGETERAEFIRVQCEIERDYVGVVNAAASALHRREGELFERHHGDWYGTDPAPTINDDWFDDPNSQGDHAEVRYLVRAGMVRAVAGPLAWLIGNTCPCGVSDAVMDRYHLPRHDSACITCHGTGRTPGHGAAVVSRHPVTRVVATDREPLHITFRCLSQGNYRWLRRLEYGSPAFLPDELFWRIKGRRVGDFAVDYPTREAAETALSRALVDLARERAGLPPITWEPSADPVKQNWHSPLRYEA